MSHVFNALLPICLIITIGYVFKYFRFPSDNFWPNMDKFTYHVLMPCLLVNELATAKIDFIHTMSLVATVLCAILIVLVLLIALNVLIHFDNRDFTSIVQGGIRFNSYAFLALVNSIFGSEGLALAAIVMAFAIPFINILCVSVFLFYVPHNDSFSFKNFLKTLIKNPLISSCIVGIFLNILGNPMPTFVLSSIATIGKAALPMGLLSVGVVLELRYFEDQKKELLISSFAKLVVMPMFAYGMGIFLELSALTLGIAMIFASMPTATSSHILSRELGGNVSLMASIITLETLLCMGTLLVAISFVIN